MPRWITVSNRLPFNLNRDGTGMTPATGGLVSALSGVKSQSERLWIGCAPENLKVTEWPKIKASIEAKDKDGWRYHPVFTSPLLYEAYYNGCCNDVLWPLLHYQPERVAFDASTWRAYNEMNERVAAEIALIAKSDDLVWVHDYHLFLVPKILKRLRPDLRVGFFLHVPFPSSEVFRHLPVRSEILASLLDADLVGFHDYSYLQHFCSSVLSILGIEAKFLSISRGSKVTKLGVFPVSIDTEGFIRKARAEKVQALQTKWENSTFLFLGVDRLDYMKGIDLKLKAFRELLKLYPKCQEKVSLLQVAVPTRTGVMVYMDLARETAQLVGEINGEFSTPVWTPVQYIHASVDSDQLLALYRASDGLLVSSKRDGMNLVALEYIAAQAQDDPGVVLLSEFTGAISTLSHTLPINPWDLEDTARKMRIAMDMPIEERIFRNRTMLDYLRNYTATDWAESFISELASSEPQAEQEGPPVMKASDEAADALTFSIMRSEPERIVLFLDYDGTIVPIQKTPAEAVLSERTRADLKEIAHYQWLDLVIVSGRDSRFLANQLNGIHAHLACEHGAKSFDPKTGRWRKHVYQSRATWYPSALRIFTDYAARVPHSHIEKKQYAIAWHFRSSPREYGEFQARKLAIELERGLATLPVNIIRGKKVIEVRAIEANKGSFARSFLESAPPNTHAIGIGDDMTDEDLFRALKGRGLSIRVDSGPSIADASVPSQEELMPLLKAVLTRIDRQMKLAKRVTKIAEQRKTIPSGRHPMVHSLRH